MNAYPTNRKRKIIIWGLLAAIIIVLLFLVIVRTIDRFVYEERKELLSLSTGTAASIVNQNSKTQWEVYSATLSMLRHAFEEQPTLESAINQINSQHDFGKDYYFLVDENGKYYASDGWYGKITDFHPYISSTADSTEYLATLPHMDRNQTYMFYRGRLAEPLQTVTRNGETKICYFVYAQDLGSIKEALVSLYPGDINIFIYDEDGTMLYKQFGIELLIQGYNIYPKFKQCKLTFGEDPDELVRKCRANEPFTIQMEIGGREFFFCSSPLELKGMSLAFVIQNKFLERMTASFFARTMFALAFIMLVLGSFIVSVIISAIKRKNAEEKLSDSRKVASALAEVSKAKTDFLSNMSHDIRTPINGIMGVTTLAKGAVNDPAKMTEYLGKIDKTSHHLLSLINDVLDMSRIESGKTQIVCKPADIRMICDNCCSIIEGQLSERTVEFITEIEASHPAILADDLHLRQILINILGNSVKFTKDGGKIWFRCLETGFDGKKASYKLEVEDTGIGMSEKFLEHIFEPFSQEENGGRTNYKGTGLGMSITKNLIDLMGGTIKVTSELGKGSRFTIDLAFDIDTEAKTKEADVKADVSIEGLRILLVEDNELNSEIAVELLKMCGAEIDTAFDGLQAIDKFSSKPAGSYDVILMDVMMPNMNGLDATRAIRALERDDAGTIPIIAMTANAFEDDIRQTTEAGMNAHLSKPIDLDQVVSTISKHCKKQ